MEKGSNSKVKIIILLVVVVVALLVLNIFLFLYRNDRPHEVGNGIKLEDRLTDIGREFYEHIYYKNIDENSTEEERNEFLHQYQYLSLKISLSTLSKTEYSNLDINRQIGYFNERNCSFENTAVIITPKEPYNVDSYEISVELDCDEQET